jgi:hypothetical protein
VFWAIGINCPLQRAQSLGAKFPANILISPINGSAMVSSLGSRWKKSCERNDKVYALKGHNVIMTLPPAGIHYRLIVHQQRAARISVVL